MKTLKPHVEPATAANNSSRTLRLSGFGASAVLVSAPAGIYIMTEDGREVHVGEEIPSDCRVFYIVGPSAPTGMTITVPEISIAEVASGGSAPRPSARAETALTAAQMKRLREAGAKHWFPVGGPEHRVAQRLTELGLYSVGTGKPTERGRAVLALVDK